MPRSGPEYSDDLRQGVDYFEVLGVDETAILWDVISVSAGTRGAQILLHPDDYTRATGATQAAISRAKV